VRNTTDTTATRGPPGREKGTSLILTVTGPSANRPECHEPLARSRSIGRGHPLSGTRETWAAPFAPRKVLHDAASPLRKRKRPCVTNRSGEPVQWSADQQAVNQEQCQCQARPGGEMLVVAGADRTLDLAFLEGADGLEDLFQGVGVGGDERPSPRDAGQALEQGNVRPLNLGHDRQLG